MTTVCWTCRQAPRAGTIIRFSQPAGVSKERLKTRLIECYFVSCTSPMKVGIPTFAHCASTGTCDRPSAHPVMGKAHLGHATQPEPPQIPPCVARN